jgi:hypothetical protein
MNELPFFNRLLGRQVELPPISEATFEALVDVIQCVVSEAVNVLGFSGVFVVFDNLENLTESELGAALISFRDTLFSIDKIWWILIGQSGLGSLVQALDPRVFERITGSGIEMQPVRLSELEEAIAKRVTAFHVAENGKAPLPETVHRELFEASSGEMRFVFKYSHSICTKFVERLRAEVVKVLTENGEKVTKESVADRFNVAIGEDMIQEQIDEEVAMSILKDIVRSEIDGLFLKPKEIQVLKQVGDKGRARASDYRDFGIKTMQDFSSNYLSKMWSQKLLIREQEGRSVYYRLRGASRLYFELGLNS